MSVQVAVSSSFTAEPVGEYIEYWLDRIGLAGEVSFAPYNQVLQQLLDPGSLLHRNTEGLNAVFVRACDARAEGRAGLDEGDVRGWAGELARAIEEHGSRARVPLLVVVCPEAGQPAVVGALHEELRERLRGMRGVDLRHSEDIFERYPLSVNDVFDDRADALAKIPYTSEFFAALATVTVRRLYGELARRPKAIAVDCDNTLWDGVCGEIPPADVRFPARCLQLQRFLVAQAAAGVLICLCSKNSLSDVERVFRERAGDMPLSWADVAAHRVNWASKSTNINALARDLDIGRDTFAFIDDNPVELAEVRAGCPDVLVIPAPVTEVDRFFAHLWPFDAGPTTDEDRRRTEFYRSNAQRAQLEEQTGSFATFIRQLELRVDVRPAREVDVERVVQLTKRTTQFNTTGEIYGPSAVADYRDDDGKLCLVAHVSDRFGSYGLVGSCFARVEGKRLVVDALQFSCRALGRGAEYRFARHIGEAAVDLGLSHVDFRCVQTPRNAPARAFLASLGEDDASSQTRRCDARLVAQLEFDPESTAAERPHTSNGRRTTGWAMDSRTAVEIAETSHSMRTVRSAVRSARPGVAPTRGRQVDPRDEYEGVLAQLWADVLDITEIDVETDVFTAYGATSVHAMRVVAALQRRLGIEVAPEDLLAVRTIAGQARVVRDGAPHDVLVPLRQEGAGAPLFLVHPAGGTSFAYLPLAKMIEGRPVWGIQDPYILRSDGQHDSVQEMKRAYVAAVRRVQPRGPYFLGGWSLGGTVAFEMAVQLEARGEEVQLFLFDPFAPGHGLRPIVMSAYWAAQARLWGLASRLPWLGRMMFRRLRTSEDPWERIGMIMLSRADRASGRAIARLAFPGVVDLEPECSEAEAWRRLFDHARQQAPEKVLPGATAHNTFQRLRVMAGHARLETHHTTKNRFGGAATLYAAEDSPSVAAWSRLLTGSFTHVPVAAQPQGRLRTPHTAFLHERNLPLFIDDLRCRLEAGPASRPRTTEP